MLDARTRTWRCAKACDAHQQMHFHIAHCTAINKGVIAIGMSIPLVFDARAFVFGVAFLVVSYLCSKGN
jgi:hypothetical protein